jgi:hypothetical protein
MVSGRPTSVNDSISAPAGKLGLFVQPAHAGQRQQGAGRRPDAAPSPIRNRDTASVPRFGKLALFCGGSPCARCIATPCRHSTCPRNGSCPNWVCLAQLGLRVSVRLPEIGFVCSQGRPSLLRNTSNWVCLYNRPRRRGMPAQAGRSRRNSSFNPQSDNSAEGGRRLPGAVPEICNPQFICPVSSHLFFPVSNRKSSIINHKSEGVPLIGAVLQESVHKNGWRRPRRLP